MITVIVPCFNASGTLRDACESLPANAETDIEILLVDDGSSDGTRDLIEELASQDSRIRPILLPSNAGVSTARNTGLDQAKGDWIFFLDADDKLRPGCLDKLAAHAVDGVDFVRARHWLWDPVTDTLTRNDGEELAFAEMHGIAPTAAPQISAIFTPWNALFRRARIEDTGLRFDPDLRIGEDRHFNLRFLKSCRSLTLLNDYTYLWRKPQSETDQATRVLVKQPEEVFKGIRTHLKLLSDPWFSQNPRHRDYLATTMLIETVNFLHAFARLLDQDAMPTAARRDINKILKSLKAEWIDFEQSGLKGHDPLFAALYDLARRQTGKAMDPDFVKAFLSGLSEVRRTLNARRPDATIGALSKTAFQWARNARPEEALQLELEILTAARALDRRYYRDMNPDVAASGIDEVRHYVEFGAAELRNPNDWFTTASYFNENPGVFLAGINPLAHFVTASRHQVNWAV